MTSGHFHPQYSSFSLHRDKLKSKIKQKLFAPESYKTDKLATIGKFSIWLVDGTKIRDEIDNQWVCGGNPARDIFLPKGEIWIEKNTTTEDLIPFVIHECVEYIFMLDGLTYDEAHEKAGNIEIKLRETRNQWSSKDLKIVVQDVVKNLKSKNKNLFLNESSIKLLKRYIKETIKSS